MPKIRFNLPENSGSLDRAIAFTVLFQWQ